MTTRTTVKALHVAIAGMVSMLAFGSAEAALIDFTPTRNLCSTTNGADVCNDTGVAPSSGSGTFPSFVGTSGGQPNEFFMYNTTNVTADGNQVGTGSPKNRAVQLGTFSVTQRNSVDVVTFVLDINQVSSGGTPPPTTSLLSLDHIALFLSANGDLTNFNAAANGGAGSLGGQAPTWYMGLADTIKLDFDFAAGSGRPDLYLYIPVSLLGGASGNLFVQLYSLFGATSPWFNNDGFEEWAYLSCYDKKGVQVAGTTCYDPRTPPPPPDVPEPGTLALLGLGLLGLGVTRRRRS